MKRRLGIFLIVIFFFAIAFQISLAGSMKKNAKRNGKVIIFHAGSLSVPFKIIEENYEKMHPEIDIQREASGSQKAARKIIDLKKPCDIMASADYRIIDKLLIPEYADWNILFASNQMVLCYTKTSRYSNEITKDNWYNILQKKDVVWGHSDPNLDPCGYRALMVMQLAEWFYKIPGLYAKLIESRSPRNIRPKSVELISLLQTGNMDYAWEYRSVAIQHNLKFIALPDEINLGNYNFDNIYSKASVKITGKKPGTTMIIKGKSITYGITILKNAPDRKEAIDFLAYLLDPKGGLKILKEAGQPPLIPIRVSKPKMRKILPDRIKSLIK